jgi:hypothetical protein
MTNRQIADALLRLCPDAQYTLVGDEYDDINWLSDVKKPTKASVIAEIAKEPQMAAAKQSAKAALLERLGITEDEAKLLLG